MKIIVRVKGGLGNQLFCYAAARQLAVKFNAELVIDNISGFSRAGLKTAIMISNLGNLLIS